MNDIRIIRDRLAVASDAFDAARAGGEAFGSAAMLASTTTVSSYPTTAQSTYACNPLDADGTESEGSAATYTAQDTVVYALNLGTQVPPSGTNVILHSCGGRWIFRYDG